MTPKNCESMIENIREEFTKRVLGREIAEERCLVRLPFTDHLGDPIEITISDDGAEAVIDDGGAIAGILFSLGQHTEDTPAFKLLKNLERAHGLQIDFDDGLVRITVPSAESFDGITELAKVVLTMDTAVPHIRVSPRRMRPVGGQRVKSKIRHEYDSMRITHLVEKDFHLDGATVPGWPVDFHWSIGINGESKDIHVVAADLNVLEPLEKAQKISAFSMDTRDRSGHSELRVVMDTHGEDSRASEAAAFLRFHSQELGYTVFDFGQNLERSKFLSTSLEELTGTEGAAWRELWTSRPDYREPVIYFAFPASRPHRYIPGQ